MKNMTIRHIIEACGGKANGCEAIMDTVVTDIVTDSRKASPGSLYIPMRGARDGHDFIGAAFENGAIATLTEKKDAAAGRPFIKVNKCAEAIQRIAEFYRMGFDIPVIGITGSVGKTSTKEMIASVLAEKYRVLKTLGNFNNNLGLPLTVFRLREEDEIAVLEMGISHFGEMTDLARTARPDAMVITNIGDCHLEFLKDRQGVFEAKTECFEYLSWDGSVVLNGDDPYLAAVDQVHGHEPVFYGLTPRSRIYADNIRSLGIRGIACTINIDDRSFDVTIPLPGEHNVLNALAGAAVGALYGLTDEEIARGISHLKALPGRFNVIDTDLCTVIDDCYNANPMSMKADLTVLSEESARKVAILGDMGELGEKEEEMHCEVGAFAGGLPIDRFLIVGKLGEKIVEGILSANPAASVAAFAEVPSLIAALPSEIQKGDVVLVKASHFMGFSDVTKALTGSDQ